MLVLNSRAGDNAGRQKQGRKSQNTGKRQELGASDRKQEKKDRGCGNYETIRGMLKMETAALLSLCFS